MPEIKLRSLKGSALTHTEMDENLQNLLNSSSLAGNTSDGSATLTLFSSASLYPTNTYGLGITFPYTGSALITGSLEVIGNITQTAGSITTAGFVSASRFDITGNEQYLTTLSGSTVTLANADTTIEDGNEIGSISFAGKDDYSSLPNLAITSVIKSKAFGDWGSGQYRASLVFQNAEQYGTTLTDKLVIAPDKTEFSASAVHISGSGDMLQVTGSIRVAGTGSFSSHLQAHCMGLGQAPPGVHGQLNALNVVTTYLSSSGATYVSASFGTSNPTDVVLIDQGGQLYRTSSAAVGGGGSGAAFPYSGSAQITGSLSLTGSLNATNMTVANHLIPGAGSTDLGSNTNKWNDIYLSNAIQLGTGPTTITEASYGGNITTIAFTGSNQLRYTKVNGDEVDVDLSSLTGSASSLVLYSETGTSGIGTASIAGQLDVAGKVTAQEFHTEYVTSSVIFESGSTQFGDTIDDTHNFHGVVDMTGSLSVTGSIEATGDVIAYASSDERLKDNVELIPQPIDKLKQIKGVSFDWNDQSEHTGHDIGVIAQDIEKILPELVATRDNGYKAVRYEKIVALLIEAIKDQQSQIDELRSKI